MSISLSNFSLGIPALELFVSKVARVLLVDLTVLVLAESTSVSENNDGSFEEIARTESK